MGWKIPIKKIKKSWLVVEKSHDKNGGMSSFELLGSVVREESVDIQARFVIRVMALCSKSRLVDR